MTGSPWLSVIMPVYNGASFLRAAIDSVICQSDDGVEIVISDDGSTDGSRDIADSYARTGRVRIIEGPRARNWVRNSNEAIEHCRSGFATFLHQDDLWLPGRSQAIRRLMQQFPNAAMWLGPSHFIDVSGRRVGTWRLPFGRRTQALSSQRFLEAILVQNFIAMPAPVFARSTFEHIGRMDETLWFTADWDLWIRLARVGEVGVTHVPMTCFRIHATSQTITGSRAPEEMHVQMETVRNRHVELIVDEPTRRSVDQAGRFATQFNVFLATLIGGGNAGWKPILSDLAHLDFKATRRFLRDSRFLERSLSRLRVGLASRRIGASLSAERQTP